jgi:hypothetical protein
MDATPPPDALLGLIDRLDPDAIRARIRELDGQSDALRVLLHAALARRPRATREARHQPSPQEVPFAS